MSEKNINKWFMPEVGKYVLGGFFWRINISFMLWIENLKKNCSWWNFWKLQSGNGTRFIDWLKPGENTRLAVNELIMKRYFTECMINFAE